MLHNFIIFILCIFQLNLAVVFKLCGTWTKNVVHSFFDYFIQQIKNIGMLGNC